ncbi:hypothetical protein H8S90_08770 [Olivibacter sp. SDN3]|uniref:hypothetical protein n=1 Tax=Olivibacter sp. SDN3 TaxID=2764720 RepID=UPI00165126CC|nr:hypothetical protein [Olivibacter sp. SDN3]QNL51646.1 hypothetical protein H8S90_08770 [Olivibacter sp. SDN3]
MKYKIILFSLPALVLLLNTTCGKNEAHCLSTDLGWILPSIEDTYGCTDTRRSLDIALNNDYTVISNKAEYDEKVTGECHPDIVFDKYDLLIGKKGFGTGNSSIHYELRGDCKGNKILHVSFYQGWTTEAPSVTYHVLLPKAEDNQEIIVETTIISD